MSPTALGQRAMRGVLERELACQVVVTSDFAATGVWAALRSRPDVTVVDCDAPTPEALDAVQMVPRVRAPARILLVTALTDENVLMGWRACALDGAVLKEGDLEELATGLDHVLAQKRYFSEPLRRALLRSSPNDGRRDLSPREAELLPLLASGMKLQDAASRMQISYKTADSYRTSLLRKLGLRDRVELVRYAIREKIITP